MVKRETLYYSGKGLGSFVGGQLSQLPQGLTAVFTYTSMFTGGGGLLTIIIYFICGQRWERQVVAEKKTILDEMEMRHGGENADPQRRVDTISSDQESSITKL